MTITKRGGIALFYVEAIKVKNNYNYNNKFSRKTKKKKKSRTIQSICKEA